MHVAPILVHWTHYWRKICTSRQAQQAEQASFTREEIPRRASQFFLKINKR
jgi:hypothetical protein